MRTPRFVFVLSAALLALTVIGQAPPGDGGSEVRDGISRMYKAWGRARVTLDKETIARTLAPEFYVLLEGRKIPRDEFIGMVTQQRGSARLTRFDVDVLTVQSTKDGWMAVIAEKLEYENPEQDQKVYSYWITRDGWRKEGDRWIATSSEAIGYETWRSGAKPPLENW